MSERTEGADGDGLAAEVAARLAAIEAEPVADRPAGYRRIADDLADSLDAVPDA